MTTYTTAELKNYAMDRKTTGTPRKFMIFFDGCNNDCIHCFAGDKSKIGFDKAVAKALILKYPGTMAVFLTGGEPTLHPDLKEMIEFCRDNGRIPCLMTNARTLSDAAFLDELINLGLEGVIVPFHSHDAAVHNFMTNTDSFDETIKGIRNCTGNRETPTHKGNTFGVQLMLIVHKLNYLTIDKTLEFMCSLNPDVITIESLIFAGNTIDNQDELSVSISEVAIYLEKGFDVLINQGVPFAVNSFPLCLFREKYWGYFYSHINDKIATNFKFKEESEIVTSGLSLAEKCADCRMKGNCPGTWETYYSIFGDGEFNVIR